MKVVYCFLVLLLLFSCKDNNAINPLDKLEVLDVKLGIPEPGEWMAEHKENGQTFEQYKAREPISVTDEMNIIYIQPIGAFNDSEKEIVTKTVAYVHLFFGLDAILLKPISEEMIPAENKRMKFDHEQLDASYILDKILPQKTPSNGIVIMAITAKDLYPSSSWNYVFGLANYKKRTGISSFNRFNDEKDFTLCLDRTIKTAVHEIGHMFSLNHCKHAVCLMNGVNHLPESDTKPNVLCSECLKKLSWNFKFDDKKRLEELINFLILNQLDKDALILQKQLDALK